MCFDGIKRLCHIRGKLRKKVWINQSDIVLIGLRDYQDAKADVILKYSADEARNLKSYGEFPETVKINETVSFGEEGIDDDIEFDDVESSDEEDIGVDELTIFRREKQAKFIKPPRTDRLHFISCLFNFGDICLGLFQLLQLHYCIKISSSLLRKIHPR